MKKIYLFFMMLFASALAYGTNFSVAPTRFVLRIDKVATNEVYVSNNTQKPLRIETYIESDAEFGSDYNLNSNIAVFPKVIGIKPGGKQVVRFRVKPGQNMEDGEYKSYIVFKEIPPEIKTMGEKKKSGDSTTNITIVTELGISIYGGIGEEVLKGGVENFKGVFRGKFLEINFDAVSHGNTSFKYKYIVEDGGGNILNEGKAGISPRNGKKHIRLGISELPKIKGNSVKIKLLEQYDNIVHKEKVKI